MQHLTVNSYAILRFFKKEIQQGIRENARGTQCLQASVFHHTGSMCTL